MTSTLRIFAATLALLLVAVITSQAQSGKFYEPATGSAATALQLQKGFKAYRLIRQDIPAIQDYISVAAAAMRGSAAPAIITIPFPDGRDVVFLITPTQVLDKDLAAENPQIRTFKGVSADGAYTLRLTTSPMGMAGVASGEGHSFYFVPLSNTSPDVLLVYDAQDVTTLTPLQCGVKDDPANELQRNLAKGHDISPLFGDGTIRTYRLAVACTAEYTTWAGSQANALVTITTTVNNVNSIYERDLSIHFTLSSPTTIRFSGTDPYSTGQPASATLTENQATLDNTTYLPGGTASYDVGFVFCALGSGGLASKPAACNTSNKAKGSAGLNPTNFASGPSGPVFDLTVAHEIGHMFNASHSFAANNGSCGGGNVSPTTGWEPGGGSTIMAYAFTCSPNYYQANDDGYFHGGNLSEMSAYMIGTATCATTAANTSADPILNTALTGTAYTIPNSTPFKLTGYAAESESDLLTYTWEQLDPVNGTGTSSAPAGTNATGPLFRSFPPTTDRTRYFPSLAGLVGINPITYEVLPTVARTMNYRLTVRDNNSGGYGRTANQDLTVTTLSCNGFGFTSQTTAGSFVANGTNTIPLTWNTATACLACANVNVRFSKDGGRTYPYLIASNIPNNGTASVTVPNLPTTTGRLMIECASNIYFNINAANQTVTSTCGADGATFGPATPLYAGSTGAASLNQSLSPNYGTAISSPITGTIALTDPASYGVIYNNTTVACDQYNGDYTNYDIVRFRPAADATYTFTGAASDPSGLVYTIYDSSFIPTEPCRNLLKTSITTTSGSSSFSKVVSAALTKNKTYVFLVSSFNSLGSPLFPASLPANYSVAVTGGTIYSDNPNPGATFNYSYVIVNIATGVVTAVQATGDMTSFAAGNYAIYGISSTSTAAQLNTLYAGTSFASMRTAIFNQTGGVCGSFSSNSRNVGIATPLPVVLASFDGRLTGHRSSMLYWEAGLEQSIADYELERSYDGSTFESIAHIAAKNRNGATYTYTDSHIAEAAMQALYRLKINEAGNTPLYSGIVHLKLDPMATTISIAPNPVANGRLETVIQSANGGEYDISLSDITGRVLQSGRYTLLPGSNRFSTAITSFASGVYFIRLRGDNGIETKKFIKE